MEEYWFLAPISRLAISLHKQLGRWMKKTTSCKKATELPNYNSSDCAGKNFSAQSAGRNSTTSGTGSVRINSQGLFSSSSKLSPENIASSRQVAPGSPSMGCYLKCSQFLSFSLVLFAFKKVAEFYSTGQVALILLLFTYTELRRPE